MPSPAADFLFRAGLVLLLGGAGLPGVGPGDPRVPVDANLPPWRGIGRVQTELGGRCTGFLIAPRLAVTAAHCLYLPRVGNFIQPGSVHFVIGYGEGAFSGHARVRAYGVGPGYDPRQESRTLGADWAVLELDASIGTQDRIFSLLRAPPAIDDEATLGGYDQDREEIMEVDPACHVTGWSADGGGHDVFHHDCAGTRGTSGAPLLIRDVQRRWIVAGVQVAAAIGGKGGLAVPVFAINAAKTVKPYGQHSPNE